MYKLINKHRKYNIKTEIKNYKTINKLVGN